MTDTTTPAAANDGALVHSLEEARVAASIENVSPASVLATLADFGAANNLTGRQLLDVIVMGHMAYQKERGPLPVPVMTLRFIPDGVIFAKPIHRLGS